MTKKKVRKLKSVTKTKGSEVSQAKVVSSDVQGASTKKAEPVAQVQVSKLQAIKQYFLDVRAEFDKITWPSKKETISMTIAVLAISIFFAVYLGLVDMVLSKLVGILMD